MLTAEGVSKLFFNFLKKESLALYRVFEDAMVSFSPKGRKASVPYTGKGHARYGTWCKSQPSGLGLGHYFLTSSIVSKLPCTSSHSPSTFISSIHSFIPDTSRGERENTQNTEKYLRYFIATIKITNCRLNNDTISTRRGFAAIPRCVFGRR